MTQLPERFSSTPQSTGNQASNNRATSNQSQGAGSSNSRLFPDTISSAANPPSVSFAASQIDTMSSAAPPPAEKPKEKKSSGFGFLKAFKPFAKALAPHAKTLVPLAKDLAPIAKAAATDVLKEVNQAMKEKKPEKNAQASTSPSVSRSETPEDGVPPTSEKETMSSSCKESIHSNLESEKVSTEALCSQSKKISKLEEKIRELLQEKEPNFVELDRLLREFFFRILKKMLINEHQIGLDELKRLEEDVKNIRGTYNTVAEMFVGIASGVLNAVSGLVGMGSGIGSFAGLSEAFVKNIGNLTNGASTFSRALDPIQGMIRSSNEEKRVLFNHQKERDSQFKSATDAVLQAIRSVMSSHKSQSSSAEDALHQAYLRLSIVN